MTGVRPSEDPPSCPVYSSSQLYFTRSSSGKFKLAAKPMDPASQSPKWIIYRSTAQPICRTVSCIPEPHVANSKVAKACAFRESNSSVAHLLCLSFQIIAMREGLPAKLVQSEAGNRQLNRPRINTLSKGNFIKPRIKPSRSVGDHFSGLSQSSVLHKEIRVSVPP